MLYTSPRRFLIARRVWLGLSLLSASTLAFEINLTRLFSVAQFYHFAFMIVSIALLGFGASGAALTMFPALRKADPGRQLSRLALAAGISFIASYLLTNLLPFDSFSIAWDRTQVLILVLHYIALAAPFFFSGMALGFLLAAFPHSVGKTYAVNLLGSAAGCVVALIAPSRFGAEGMVTLSALLAALAGLTFIPDRAQIRQPAALVTMALLIFSILDLGGRLTGRPLFPFMELRISPYKSLSYALQYPGARVVLRQWNAFSRLDVIRSGGIHSVPGLSYRYLKPLPRLDGLFVDGDDLSPIFKPLTDPVFAAHLPNAAAFLLRPQADALILEPRGGLDVFLAFALGSGQITAVEINPAIVEAVPLYDDPRVQVYVESDRSHLRRSREQYDVIVISLASSFHPVRSGAYTLAEDYRYTVESFGEALTHLEPDGLLIATRWLQNPPSEDLRLFALGVTALENAGADPRSQIAAFRGYNMATLLLKRSPFTAKELSFLRDFAARRAFDLTYAPGILPEETNQYNILPESIYYQAYTGLLEADPRETFYNDYEYDVRPPTDDHPFFGHYFKWAQAPQVIAEFGRAWQPFGGAGYFVIVALLLLAIVLAGIFILLPAAIWKRRVRNNVIASPFPLRSLVYFGLIGFAFLFVEIPLLQRFILYLGNPAYAFTAVLFSVLFFSGFGSRISDRLPLRPAMAILVILILLAPALLPRLLALTLGLRLIIRFALTALFLAPVGFLMGIPFPAGIRMMKQSQSKGGVLSGQSKDVENEAQDVSIPWIWAVNGAASVVASILSALLALTFGFNWVLRLGALAYAGAWLTVWRLVPPDVARHRNR